jgi:hypothetical protein
MGRLGSIARAMPQSLIHAVSPVCNLQRKNVVHLAATSDRSRSLSNLRAPSTSTGTRKITTLQIKYVTAAVKCRMVRIGLGTICATYQILTRRYCGRIVYGVLDTGHGGKIPALVYVLVQ